MHEIEDWCWRLRRESAVSGEAEAEAGEDTSIAIAIADVSSFSCSFLWLVPNFGPVRFTDFVFKSVDRSKVHPF